MQYLKMFGIINFHHYSMFHEFSIFIALRPMGFRPLDRRMQDFQLATHQITPQCEISISRRKDIASRASSLDILQLLAPSTDGDE